ncbi:MAG: hypothetical protein WDO06_06555 [Actinomycetota bacterium]
MSAVRKEAESIGYREIAAAQSSANVKAERNQSRRRRPTWADEK